LSLNPLHIRGTRPGEFPPRSLATIGNYFCMKIAILLSRKLREYLRGNVSVAMSTVLANNIVSNMDASVYFLLWW
jgi:hypothetical protein